MAKKKAKQEPQCGRNLMHNHPLMRKCDVHGKSTKARRRLDRVKMIKQWPDESVFA